MNYSEILSEIIKDFAKKRTKEVLPQISNLDKKYMRPKKGKCMFPGCKSNAIHSHAISKKHYLLNICTEDGHVGAFMPKRNAETKEFEWKRVGINDATAFLGFCKEHDTGLFESIDNNGLLQDKDVLLQCYRTICWCLLYEEAASALSGRIKDMAEDDMRKRMSEVDLDYDKIMYDPAYQAKKYNIVESLEKIKQSFEDVIDEDVIHNDAFTIEERNTYQYYKISNIIEIYKRRLDIEIPIALQSMTNIRTDEGQGTFFHIVLPEKGSTDIILINASKLKFRECWEARTATNIESLGLIESWMIDSENWFIRPDVIESLSKEKQEFIADDIRYASFERQPWKPYDMSIFDGIRRDLNESFEDKFPDRPPRDIREKNMLQKIQDTNAYNDYRRNR